MSEITNEELRVRSQALDDAQEVWEELAYMSNAKMPCPECSGAGVVHGGSLGDVCVRCMGVRVIDQPGSQRVMMPPFPQLRAGISAYGDALADRALPHGHRGRRNLALPEASSVVDMESIDAIRATGRAKVLRLQASPGVVDERLLSSPTKAKGMRGDGDLGEYEDAELVDIEDAAKP